MVIRERLVDQREILDAGQVVVIRERPVDPAGRCWMLSLAGCCGDEKDNLRALGNLSWTGAMMGVEDLGLTGGFVDVLC